MRTFRRMFPALFLFALLAPAAALAGQVRVDVGSGGGTVFSPSASSLNLGDQVVWVWKFGGHTVTSGNTSTCTPDGIFSSGAALQPAGTSFAWKSDRTGSVPYFCIPHCPIMVATLTIATSGTAVPSFRITEVRYNSADVDSNFIEICNLGTGTGNLGLYRISIQSGAGTVTLPLQDISVAAGQCILVHPGGNLANTATDFYFSSMPAMTASGSAALYVPNSVAPALTDATMLVDFVQWGAAAQPNEATAVSAGLWGSGNFIPSVGPFHSLEFCGAEPQHGSSFWEEIAAPTPGVHGTCSTPSLPTTWGRIKSLYR